MTTFVGIVIGIGVMVFAITGVEASYMLFINVHGILIVFGGVIASTLTSFSYRELMNGFKAFLLVFTRRHINYVTQINEIAEVASIYLRGGFPELEKKVDTMRNNLFKDGLKYFLSGYKKEEVITMIEGALLQRIERETTDAKMLRQMGKFAPAFGMVGTVVGMIFMLSQMGVSPEKMGPFLATALTATFYGLFLANVVFYPMGEKIGITAEGNFLQGKIWIDGVGMIIEKRHPLYVKDKLAALIAPKERSGIYKQQVSVESSVTRSVPATAKK